MGVIGRRAGGARNRLRRAVSMLRGHDPAAPVRQALAASDTKLAAVQRRLSATESRLTAAERLLTAQSARLEELTGDLSEQRGLAMRIAELSDVVAHLLAVASSGDREALDRALAEFADGV
jgi:hypothetical protein